MEINSEVCFPLKQQVLYWHFHKISHADAGCTKCPSGSHNHSLLNVFPSLSTCSKSHMPLSRVMLGTASSSDDFCVCGLHVCVFRADRTDHGTKRHTLTNPKFSMHVGLLYLIVGRYITDSYQKQNSTSTEKPQS